MTCHTRLPGLKPLRTAMALALALTAWMPLASARPEFLSRVPNNAGCSTCHNNINGGEGCSLPPCLNPFGQAFRASDFTWTPELAGEDTDGDGCANGEELGDPDGTFVPDSDWEQPLEDDFCARSPGLAPGSGTTLECARRDAFCCDRVERSRLDCECADRDLGTVLCSLGSFLPNDESNSPTPLLDGVYTEVNTFNATSTEPNSSCGVGTRDVWFEVRPDCVTGNLVIELEDEGDIAVLADRSDPFEHELFCETDATRVELEARRVLIRVSGVSMTRIRATCEPDASAPAAEASVCANAESIFDGQTSVNINSGTSDGASLIPTDPCPSDVEKDKWFAYEASCTGIAAVSARFGQVDSEICLVPDGIDMVLAVYAAQATCPERDLLLACLPRETEACDSVSATAQLPVTRGEELYIRVGRASPLSFSPIETTIDVSCQGPVDSCTEYCAARAECEFVGDDVDCSCRDLYAGDGRPVERGGTGCELSSPCTDLGLSCSPNGRCTFNETTATCECDEGYTLLGAECRPDPDYDCDFGAAGDVECSNGRPHAECLPLDFGYQCVCERGYSPIPGSDPFDCDLVCGDGVKGPGEECDDGNGQSDDGCNSRCEEEDFFNCFEPSGGRSECEETCGDGLIDLPFEQCDDGNTESGDGCDEECQDEASAAGCGFSISCRLDGQKGRTPLSLCLVAALFGLGWRRFTARPDKPA